MERFFHIDNLEGEVIKNKTFDDYWDNSMVTYGLWLTKEEFELLKSKGHLVFGNNRHENQLLAMTVLAQLLEREGDKAFRNTAEKLLNTLFPRATKEEQDIGWTLDYTYLMRLHDTLSAKYEDAPSMEQIELVLLEIEKQPSISPKEQEK